MKSKACLLLDLVYSVSIATCCLSKTSNSSFVGSEEPSLKLLCLSKLQRTNSSPISNCRHLKSAIFFRTI